NLCYDLLSLHAALPIRIRGSNRAHRSCRQGGAPRLRRCHRDSRLAGRSRLLSPPTLRRLLRGSPLRLLFLLLSLFLLGFFVLVRSEEHTSELQSRENLV